MTETKRYYVKQRGAIVKMFDDVIDAMRWARMNGGGQVYDTNDTLLSSTVNATKQPPTFRGV